MQYSWKDFFKLPERKHAIHIIGAGSIVADAHLPAYKKAGFQVASITDLNESRAKSLASKYLIPNTYSSVIRLLENVDENDIFDLAVPANIIEQILKLLPKNSAVLIQKPMGENYESAKKIAEVCELRNLTACVNFQLRFSPYIQAVRELIDNNAIGSLHDIDVRLNVYTPWHLFEFLMKEPRLEIQYHSIHYIDCIRSFIGNPSAIYAKTVKDPWVKELSSTRTNMILDYGETLRANINCNHTHKFGHTHQESYIKWEGEKGAIRVQIGLLLNYPKGKEDCLEICKLEDSESSPSWEKVEIDGTWFPDAFIGTMASLQNKIEDPNLELPTHYLDSLKTMACVEAAYQSSEGGGIPLPE
jgi:predicted dehydrogenase